MVLEARHWRSSLPAPRLHVAPLLTSCSLFCFGIIVRPGACAKSTLGSFLIQFLKLLKDGGQRIAETFELARNVLDVVEQFLLLLYIHSFTFLLSSKLEIRG